MLVTYFILFLCSYDVTDLLKLKLLIRAVLCFSTIVPDPLYMFAFDSFVCGEMLLYVFFVQQHSWHERAPRGIEGIAALLLWGVLYLRSLSTAGIPSLAIFSLGPPFLCLSPWQPSWTELSPDSVVSKGRGGVVGCLAQCHGVRLRLMGSAFSPFIQDAGKVILLCFIHTVDLGCNQLFHSYLVSAQWGRNYMRLNCKSWTRW